LDRLGDAAQEPQKARRVEETGFRRLTLGDDPHNGRSIKAAAFGAAFSF
jgi:hypothetical protein